MGELTKEEKDQYILDMIKNLTQDQTAFNINTWGVMHNYHEMRGLALEENEEVLEQLEWLKIYKDELWTMIKENKPKVDIDHMLQIVIENTVFAIQELLHEAAVYQRALDTMQKAPAGGNQADADKK